MENILNSSQVTISTSHKRYPQESPYSPHTHYPEYPFGHNSIMKEKNDAYEGVRDTLRLLDLDVKNYGRKKWNPLGEVIRPGGTVVLKPNLIRDFRETYKGHENCLMTHGSVIRAALDYVYIALKGEGRIIVADAPNSDANFDVVRWIAGLNEIQDFYGRYADFDVEVYDLRPEKAIKVNGVIVGHEPLPGDPAGYVKVDLGRHSMFCEVEHLCYLLYGSEYDTSEIRRHHTGGRHEYFVSKTILDADCIINLPKLKTHKKTGITVCLKNIVGINGNKNWLPHHRLGTPSQGGDQFADDGMKHRIERKTMACFRRFFPLLGPMRKILAKPLKTAGQSIFGDTNTNTIRSGNWYGNDTTWRMVLDLNRLLLYADENGDLQETPVRHVFCVVDGIVGGEGNGPMDPVPNYAGLVLSGINPVAVELTCARIMGFDYMQLPLLYRALNNHSISIVRFDYNEVNCRSNDQQYDRALNEFDGEGFDFEPHFGWKGHVELTPRHGVTEEKMDEEIGTTNLH